MGGGGLKGYSGDLKGLYELSKSYCIGSKRVILGV